MTRSRQFSGRLSLLEFERVSAIPASRKQPITDELICMSTTEDDKPPESLDQRTNQSFVLSNKNDQRNHGVRKQDNDNIVGSQCH